MPRQVAISMHDDCYAEIHRLCEEANAAQSYLLSRRVLLEPTQKASFELPRLRGTEPAGMRRS